MRVPNTAVPPSCPLVIRSALLIVLALAAVLAPSRATAQNTPGYLPLTATQRVYDETGTSLSPEQTADLERRLAALLPIGADAVVYVRTLDADPDATLGQVEDLQRAWVRQTGASEETAVAILINREPGNPDSARAGIFVGRMLNDGNLPKDEREAIVDDALIPSLRDGDVYGSLVAGLDRMDSSIRNGPPRSAFEKWSDGATGSWLPWAAIGTAIVGAGVTASLFRRRQTTDRPKDPPSTLRPGNLSPALASALVSGGPQASAMPATLLDMASRGALTIEPESEGSRWGKPTIQLRLVDQRPVGDDVEVAVWAELENLADDGVVSSKNLAKLAGRTKAPFAAIRRHMRANGWLNGAANRAKGGLYAIGFVALGLAVFTGVVASNGDNWWLAGAGVAALAVVAVVAITLGSVYSGLTRAGQEAAIPWKAYRDGLKAAGNDETSPLDLDAILPDVVALNLGSALDKRLEAVGSSGRTLRVFSGATGLDGATAASFPFWIAFNSSVSSASGSGSATVSSSGAGGGGGSAGST